MSGMFDIVVSGEVSDLRADLASPDAGKGAELVARRQADSMLGLVSLPAPATDGFGVELRAFYSSTDTGGGRFYWDSDRNKASANGGTIIDPNTIGTLSATSLGTFLDVQGTGVGTGCWVRPYSGKVDVEWFGADGTGDGDTSAIEAAFAVNKNIIFANRSYLYEGAGLALGAKEFSITGQGKQLTVINLAAGSRLVDTLSAVSFKISSLTVSGGIGTLRSSFTGNNVWGRKVFQDVEFTGYTGAAVENNSPDSPYWKFERCDFRGQAGQSTIGAALSGLTDGCSFLDCEFLLNRVHIKLGSGGNNAYISNCDFIRFSQDRSAGPNIDIWVVPRSDNANSGQGFSVSTSKFGNENLVVGDYRVVYADEGAGSSFGDKFPDLTTASTGSISGHVFESCLLNGNAASPSMPFIFSTTPNVADIRIGPLTLAGSNYQYFLKFLNPPGASRLNCGNILGPLSASTRVSENTLIAAPSNGVGVFHTVDPTGVLSVLHDVRLDFGTGDPGDYAPIISTPIGSYTRVATVGFANITDSLGGTNAVQIDSLDATGIYAALPAVSIGRQSWLEFDLSQGGAAPLSEVNVTIKYSVGNIHWRRRVLVPATWRRFRFPVVLREQASSIILAFSTFSSPEAGSINVGRVVMYHARAPINVDGRAVNKVLAPGGIGVGNSVAATTPGSITKKIEVFDANGISLGFIPVYNSIS